jgi:predicted nucleotide-binding protein
MKPRIFIGSSNEGLEVAYAIQENLEHVSEVTVWSQGLFDLSSFTLIDLTKALENFEFAIFVFNPDDVLIIRDQEKKAIRDNVI